MMDEGQRERPERRRSPGETARLVGAGVLLVVLVLFVVDNRHDVKVGLVFTDRRLPLIGVMVLFAVAGGLFTALVSWSRRRP